MINNRGINYLLYVHRMKQYTEIIFTVIYFFLLIEAQYKPGCYGLGGSSQEFVTYLGERKETKTWFAFLLI